MKFFYITFRSVTFAQRGEKVLEKEDVRCTMLRTPKWMESKGCGYCLRLSLGDGPKAVEVLRQKQVQMRKIYLQMEDGDIQEVQL